MGRWSIAVACLLVWATGCPQTTPGAACEGVTCSGHGACDVRAGGGVCVCDPGYVPSGRDCVPVGGDGDADEEADADDAGDDGGEEAAADCGNHVVEPPEECDDDPAPSRACTTSCDSTGTEMCALGCRWSGRCDPPVESCSGVDDDCDTEVDEGYPCIRGHVVTCATSCGSTGTGTCSDTCAAPAGAACTPPIEACSNGVDDDCDTETDELTPEQCRPGTVVSCTTSCSTTGTGTCTDGCSPPLPGACTPPAEVCNDADDDCDTTADEDFACRLGATVACTTSCSSTGSGVCTGGCEIPTGAECVPPAEACNAADDDCDGTTDDGFACVQGAAGVACTATCGTTGSGTCTATCSVPSGADCTPPGETCNAVDDDCDGTTDDGFACIQGAAGVSCTTTCGSAGIGTCTSACAVPTGAACAPPAETCNAADDDCDTAPDDGFACIQGATGVSCTTTCGSTGSGTCSSSCALPTGASCTPPAEACSNSADDDCDGETDEGCGGGRIVFVSNRSGRHEVWAMNDDGTGLRQLTFGATGPEHYQGAQSPRWSPDGTQILFSYGICRDYGVHGPISVVNADGSGLRNILADTCLRDSVGLSWTRDASSVLYGPLVGSQCDAANSIWTVRVDGTGARELYNDAVYPLEYYVDYSPMADRLVFQSYQCGANHGAFVVNVDGSGRTAIAADGVSANNTRWSASGSRVAYSRADIDMWVVNADGTGAALVPTGSGSADMPDWAGETRLVYAKAGDIYSVNLDGTDNQQLTTDPGQDYWPDWYPGRLADVPPGWGVGCTWSTPENLGAGVNTAAVEMGPSITSDGTSLYFFRDLGTGAEDIFRSDRSGGTWAVAVNLGSPPNDPTAHDLSPHVSLDGTTLTFASSRSGSTSNSDIWQSVWNGTAWGTPVRLVGIGVHDDVPWLSPDGNRLYWRVNRAAPLATCVAGSTDAWYHYSFAERVGGVWGASVCLGEPINIATGSTPAAFFSPDQRWVAFSSERPDALSLLRTDVYISENVAGVWQSPVHVLNGVSSTGVDQVGSVSFDGRELYFASDRPGGYGGFDIYISRCVPP